MFSCSQLESYLIRRNVNFPTGCGLLDVFLEDRHAFTRNQRLYKTSARVGLVVHLAGYVETKNCQSYQLQGPVRGCFEF